MQEHICCLLATLLYVKAQEMHPGDAQAQKAQMHTWMDRGRDAFRDWASHLDGIHPSY